MPFDDPLISGGGDLIRAAIRSPNFVSGANGWQLSRDGSLEAQAATIRGILQASTITGATITGGSVSGSDLSGSTLTIPAGATTGTPRIVIDSSGIRLITADDAVTFSVSPSSFAVIASVIADPTTNTILELNANNAQLGVSQQFPTGVDFQFVGTLINLISNSIGRNRFQFDSTYPNGSFYYEEVTCNNQTVVSGASYTPTINLHASQLFGPYPSCFNLGSGLWTCPENGVYQWNYSAQFQAWVSSSRLLGSINRNGTALANQIAGHDDASIGGRLALQATKYLAKGDTIQCQIGQLTAANQLLTSPTTEQSYISVRRVAI